MSVKPIRYRHYKAAKGETEKFIVLYRNRWYLFNYTRHNGMDMTTVRSHTNLEQRNQQYVPALGKDWYHGHFSGHAFWKDISAAPGRFIRKAEEGLTARPKEPEAVDQTDIAA